MLTWGFSKTLHALTKRKIISMAPAITGVEKMVSIAGRLIVYPTLLSTDLYLTSSAVLVSGFSLSVYDAGTSMFFGMVASSFILVMGHLLIWPTVIVWCALAYRNNKLRIIQL